MEIIFEAKRLEVIDENQFSNGFFLERAGNFFLAELQKAGFKPVLEQDEWGLRISMKEENLTLYLRLSNVLKDNSKIDDGLIAFRCLTGYTVSGKGKLLSLFGKLSPEEKLAKLNWTVKNILSTAGIKIISIKNDVVSA
ncbi:MAG: hypothetical protein GXN94_02550 [Aquificae bacterium]|nr:hypothetical protein [Aquificota bacterium]